MSLSPQAKVFTFYSYKGGVGRSFAMANCAVLLARWGFRVACLDWDLEAPGLHFYFDKIDNSRDGIVDWILDGRNENTPVIQNGSIAGGEDRLSVITAGKKGGCREYLARLHSVDWEREYKEHRLGERLERLREDLLERFDFVFIDSRTGITDIGGICGIHLPDVVMAILTANDQNISGTAEVTSRMIENRANLVYDRAALKVVPILSRFDARDEYTTSEIWRKKTTESLKHLYTSWLDKSADPLGMMGFTTIPYVTRWAFGEELPVLQEPVPSTEHITFSLENVAALIANRLQDNLLAIRNRASYVSSAKSKGARRSQPHEDRSIFLSAAPSKLDFSRQIAAALNEHGVLVRTSPEKISGSTTDIDQLNRELAQANSVVVLLDRTIGEWQSKELEIAVEKVFGERSGQMLLPVQVGQVDLKSLPTFLHNITWLDGREANPVAIANSILQRISDAPGPPA